MSLNESQKCAENVLEMLEAGCGAFHQDNVADSYYADVRGILRGILKGQLRKGESRLAESMLRLAESYGESSSVPMELRAAIAEAAEYGLSVSGHDLGLSKGPGHVENVRTGR